MCALYNKLTYAHQGKIGTADNVDDKKGVIYGRVERLFLCSNDEFPKVYAGPPSVDPIIR